MAMSKWQRKEALGHGAGQNIATLLGLTKQHVAAVIRGERRDARVEAVAAAMIRKTVDEVFEPLDGQASDDVTEPLKATGTR